ncbi:MAG: hypothetical protein VZR11_03225 [Succinimonas sp.]|nr:hypothetical protein [Succinimonas sp.]
MKKGDSESVSLFYGEAAARLLKSLLKVHLKAAFISYAKPLEIFHTACGKSLLLSWNTFYDV